MALCIFAGLALPWVRQPLSDALWPDTRIQQLRNDAQRALAAGELSRPDGHGARELYEAALALDPDRPGAREGLARVGAAAVAQAATAIDQGRDDDARAALRLARELAVPRVQTEPLERVLHERQVAGPALGLLLARARRARAEARLDGADTAALPLYLRVLALEPNNVEGLEGREDTLADLLEQARAAVDGGDLPRAIALIERARAVDPGHVDLPQALAAMDGAVGQQLMVAERELARGRLDRALAGFTLVAGWDVDVAVNAAAADGRLRVAHAHAARSERHAADFRLAEAASELAEAEAIAPSTPPVVAAREHLQRARLAQARLLTDLSPAQQQQRLRPLLAAAAAAARGDLLSPPGESAYDNWRQAHAIAPRDRGVRAMATELLPAARRCFEDALRGNRLTTAGGCLDACVLLEEDETRLRAARGRLAQRWMAVGDERLGAGELEAARTALLTARGLDPAMPGLEAFARRVRAAGVVE